MSFEKLCECESGYKARVVTGCHLQGGGSICCHSNQLTTEEGDIELSINIEDVSFYIIMVLILIHISHKLMFNSGHNMIIYHTQTCMHRTKYQHDH